MNQKLGFFTLTIIVAVLCGIVAASGTVLLIQSATPTSTNNTADTDSEIHITTVDESAIPKIVKNTTASVVSIIIKKQESAAAQYYSNNPFFFGEPFDTNELNNTNTEPVEVGAGSGFVASSDGLILTNRHVVSDTKAEYDVVFTDGTSFTGTVVDRDEVYDLAVLKIDPGEKELTPLPLGNSDQLEQGQAVIAIGNTVGQYHNTVTKGIISGLSRTLQDGYSGLIQTDAAINPGNSGGPLIDVAGNVIGINTAIDRSGEGIGFAIPINYAKVDLASIEAKGYIAHAGLGVRYQAIDEQVAKANKLAYDYGAYLVGQGDYLAVVPGSAADKAGLQSGDIVLEVDGVKVDADHPLQSLISNRAIGDTVTLHIVHQGSEKDVSITLEELPRDTTDDSTDESANQ